MVEHSKEPAVADDAEAAGAKKTSVAPDKGESHEPSLFKRIWEGWKRVGLFIGKVNLYILTFLVYWTAFAFTAIMTKLLRRDFLMIGRRKKGKTYWTPLPEPDHSLEKHQRQF